MLVIFNNKLYSKQFASQVLLLQGNVNSFKVTHQIYLDITHDGEELGHIEIGLFGEDAPKTVDNFRQICINGIDGLSYKGSTFHRVIDKFMIQGSNDVIHIHILPALCISIDFQ